MDMAATPPVHSPSPTDTQEDPPHSPSRKELAVQQDSPSFADRDSFDWNISWSSTAGATPTDTAKPTTSEGTEYDGIVAVAICDTDTRVEQVVGCNENSEIVTVSATPVPLGQRPVLESDVDITPMPDYHSMATPHLKVATV